MTNRFPITRRLAAVFGFAVCLPIHEAALQSAQRVQIGYVAIANVSANPSEVRLDRGCTQLRVQYSVVKGSIEDGVSFEIEAFKKFSSDPQISFTVNPRYVLLGEATRSGEVSFEACSTNPLATAGTAVFDAAIVSVRPSPPYTMREIRPEDTENGATVNVGAAVR